MFIFFFTKTKNCSICTDFTEGIPSQRGSDTTMHLSCPTEVRYSSSQRMVLKQDSPAQPPGIQARAPQGQSKSALTIQTDPLWEISSVCQNPVCNLLSSTLDLDCVHCRDRNSHFTYSLFSVNKELFISNWGLKIRLEYILVF